MTLRERLVARIRATGPISFADYVEAALYDPDGGFYARGRRLGIRGAFSTAPTRQTRFADAVAAEARICHAAVGEPDSFALVEVGPGDGSLAAALAGALGDIVTSLVLVERAAGMRAAQEQALEGAGIPVAWVETPAEARVEAGFVVANELLDALPFCLLEWPDEIVVGAAEDGTLREECRPASSRLTAALRAEVEPSAGAHYALRPGASAALLELGNTAARGRILLADYGGEGEEVHTGRDPVRTSVGGMRGAHPLEAPGSQDITADVDFGPLRRAASAAALEELAYEPQEMWRERLAPGAPGTFEPPPGALHGFKVLLLEKT